MQRQKPPSHPLISYVTTAALSVSFALYLQFADLRQGSSLLVVALFTAVLLERLFNLFRSLTFSYSLMRRVHGSVVNKVLQVNIGGIIMICMIIVFSDWNNIFTYLFVGVLSALMVIPFILLIGITTASSRS